METNSILSEVFQTTLGKKKTSNVVTDVEWNCYCFAKIDADCCGNEPLPQISYDSIRWSSILDSNLKTSKSMDQPSEYECLVRYYIYVARYNLNLIADFQMPIGNTIIVDNYVREFRLIQVLGYPYDAQGYFCAYHFDEQGQKVLRPGQIQFFFAHEVLYPKEGYSNITIHVEHFFAFVRWFKFPNANQTLASYTHVDGSCWQNTFEDLCEDCILPVHKLHSGISIRLDRFKDINTIVFLPRKLT